MPPLPANGTVGFNGSTRASQPAPAVLRATAVLGALEHDAPAAVSLAELSRRLQAAKASLSHVLDALVDAVFVRRAGGGFVLGRRLVELGGAYLAGVDQVGEFAALTRNLPVASRETVQLSTMVGREVVYLARHDGMQPLRLGTEVGMRFPATCTATGKAMLATLDDAEIASMFAGYEMPRRTTRSIANLDELLADLERARQRGYAMDDEEANEGIVCIGLVVPTAPGDEPFGVSVTILKSRLDEAYQAQLVADLRTLAASVAHPLGSVSRAGHQASSPPGRPRTATSTP